MPIREALRMLQRDGLVEFESHRGAAVANVTWERVYEAVFVRMHLEVLAVREATPWHTEASVRGARERIDRMDELVRDRPAVLSAAPHQAEGKRVVLVDEITTSGDTLRLGLAALRSVGPSDLRTATTFVRPLGYKPDYWALETGATVQVPLFCETGDVIKVDTRSGEYISRA
jgi:hypothetical protein